MGLIDTSELMSDPDFVQPLTLIRRKAAADQYGENQITENGFQVNGCVQPISGDTLQRIPEAFRVADVKSFWLKEKIIADNRCKYPDIIVKDGIRFQVQMVFDWSQWGQGWSEGTCVQEKPTL